MAVKTISIVVNGLSVPFFALVTDQRVKGEILWPRSLFDGNQNQHIKSWLEYNSETVKSRIAERAMIEERSEI
jgi:hypothetical protein